MKYSKVFVIFAILLVFAALVFADDRDGNKERDGGFETERKKEGGRSLDEAKIEDREFSLKSKTKQPGRKDEIQFSFKNEPFPRFLIRYTSQSGANKSVVANRWSILKVLEYNSSDTNAALAVGAGNFNVASQLRLWGGDSSTEVNWSKFYGGSSLVNNVKVYNVCTDLNTKQGSNGINFSGFRATVCAQISEAFVTLGSAGYADPSGFKWSISLNNYPYQKTNTRLALKVGFRSVSRVRTRTNSAGAEQKNVLSLDTSSDGGVVAAWDPAVSISGSGCPATADVISSPVFNTPFGFDNNDAFKPEEKNDDGLPGTAQSYLYFSYVSTCQPASITWDPQLAFSTTTSAASFSAPSMIFVVFSTLAALLFL